MVANNEVVSNSSLHRLAWLPGGKSYVKSCKLRAAKTGAGLASKLAGISCLHAIHLMYHAQIAIVSHILTS